MLIHAGDLTSFSQPLSKSMEMLKDINDWLGELPHRHKIVIAGNHDLVFQDEPKKARTVLTEAHYLESSGVTLEGIHFWGSPITPVMETMAFAAPSGTSSREVWDRVPDDTDVLISHGPPYGTGDQNMEWGKHHGCLNLLGAVMRVKPRLHIFGHVHGGYSKQSNRHGTWFLNCASVNTKRQLANPPFVIDLEAK